MPTSVLPPQGTREEEFGAGASGSKKHSSTPVAS